MKKKTFLLLLVILFLLILGFVYFFIKESRNCRQFAYEGLRDYLIATPPAWYNNEDAGGKQKYEEQIRHIYFSRPDTFKQIQPEKYKQHFWDCMKDKVF